ncbi:MAG: precorrin-8X methylmutase, partial [Acaryochloridaceae cyanobacterium CSU_5_19]|nr:precorrin-8X methylmutase [Acaryochloridaceae cyanobacterium CSU_5_19]
MMEYIRKGDDIYRQSFAIIREEANLSLLPADLAGVAVRLIHACGMLDIVQDLAASPHAVQVGREALAAGAALLCDTQMVAHGITQKRLPAHNNIICTLNHPQVPEIAQRIDNTRSAAALDLWHPHLQGAVVA